MHLTQLGTFFGYCTVINVALLLVSVVIFTLWKAPVSRLHAKVFDVDPEKMRQTYVSFFAIYKMAIIVFNAVPYLAVSMMG